MPEITVVITAYNLGKYIASCIDDLLSQSFQDFDVLILDDCSKDKTLDIIKSYHIRYPERIHVIQIEQNLGSPAKSRNTILMSNMITGKYTVFLDGDDVIEKNYLDRLHNLAEKNNADVAICAYDRFLDQTGEILCEEMRRFPSIIDLPPSNDILAFINGSLWNKLFRTACMKDILVPEISIGEDLLFQQLVFQKCNKIVCIDEILIHYRVRQISVISQTSKRAIMEMASAFLEIRQKLPKSIYADTVDLLAYIHIGLSMAIRASENNEINIHDHLRWTRKYFKDEYQWFRGNRFLRLPALLRHGIRGWAILITKELYRINLFNLFLNLYHIMIKVWHKDVKF